MTRRLLAIPIVSLLFVLVALGILAPWLRRNNPDVDPRLVTVMLDQARTNFDAPALEIVTQPFYRVVGYTGQTGKVAVYSRLGFRIATMTMQECRAVANGYTCGGDVIDYGLGW